MAWRGAERFLNGACGKPHGNGFDGRARVDRQEAGGNEAEPLKVFGEIGGIGFGQTTDFERNMIARVRVFEGSVDFRFGQTGELPAGKNNAQHDFGLVGNQFRFLTKSGGPCVGD